MATTDSTATPQPSARTTEAKCAFCRSEFPRGELIEVHEGYHDNLTFFNGESICKPCARANGVEF